MLPEASQARKAIWDAINPHTGIKRIDEAFPLPMRKRTLNNEMKIEFVTGSVWQVLGSDNYNSLVGSPPVGVVFSEWALAKPQAWGYVRPILAENGGWALFIYTARGRNHGFKTYEEATKDPQWFAEKLTAEQTGVFTPETLQRERLEYMREMGKEDGDALFRQEYMCDFTASVVGSFYGAALSDLKTAGHMGDFPYDRGVPVETATDIGRTDDLACIFYQKHHLRIHIIDFESGAGHDVPWFVTMLSERGYSYRRADQKNDRPPHTVPWDARPKTFGSPLSVINQLNSFGVRTRVAENLDDQDGIQAVRAIMPRLYFNTSNPKVAQLVEALENYQREWDDDRKVFSNKALHNWASHPADALRYLALSYVDDNPAVIVPGALRTPTLNEAWANNESNQEERL